MIDRLVDNLQRQGKAVAVTTITLTAIIHQEDELFVAGCPEIGTVSQGISVEEALANLREATELFLEEFPQAPPARAFMTTFDVPLYA